MFESLSDRLEQSFKLLKGQGRITEINVAETLKEVRKYSSGLSVRDAEAIAETLPFAEEWAGSRRFRTWSLFSREGESDADVHAVSPQFFSLSSLEAGQGELSSTAFWANWRSSSSRTRTRTAHRL